MPVVPAIRIGHLTLETPDLERQIEYYTTIVGLVLAERAQGKAYLTTRVGQLAVELNSGASACCTRVSLEVNPALRGSEIADGLHKEGISSQRATAPFPGVGEVVTFQDNKGTSIDLFTGGGFITANQQTIGVG